MNPPAVPLRIVPYREVRHDQPDDCLHYETIATRATPMDWTIPAHRHEGLHQFQLLEQGHVQGSIDGQAFSASAPVMLMLAPGSVHGFTYAPGSVGHQFTIPSATLRKLLGDGERIETDLRRSFVRPQAQPGEFDACASLFATLAGEFRSQQPGRVPSLLACATLVAVQFLRRGGDPIEPDARPGARDTLVQRYQGLVEQHHREQHGLAFYAGRLGVTPDHLSRACRAACGQSAQQLLHDRLMLEARRLLAYTPMGVAQVAQHLGYEDAPYFSKFFARSVGETPTRYRTLVAQGVRSAGDATP